MKRSPRADSWACTNCNLWEASTIKFDEIRPHKHSSGVDHLVNAIKCKLLCGCDRGVDQKFRKIVHGSHLATLSNPNPLRGDPATIMTFVHLLHRERTLYPPIMKLLHRFLVHGFCNFRVRRHPFAGGVYHTLGPDCRIPELLNGDGCRAQLSWELTRLTHPSS